MITGKTSNQFNFSWFNPHSEALFGPFVILLFASILQFSVFTNFPLPLQPDLITIWVALISISRPYQYSLVFSIFAGLVYETHTTVPMGQMICIYLLLSSTIRMTRSSLSWRTRKPWLFCIIGSTSVVILTELIVLFSENQWQRFDLLYTTSLVFRVFFAFIIASLLPNSILYLSQAKEEPL